MGRSVAASALSLGLIHQSVWKGRSPGFAWPRPAVLRSLAAMRLLLRR
ncbi:MAG: hypothetical protein AVDCRST_MAG01-01-3817 [uncultured Rubrobacteraceae bacterium]|uniref:Uncharacterized protein n=1 Tax=uncultured Rubrobacteraceae bacterium TaxID=349277 RepID=A0A6J4QL02_9ACTN|nr:MAG: hypothetical protein AVDCRST_MAG01-01-3817 [uncultured Rubrobacteraceae bacterium]